MSTTVVSTKQARDNFSDLLGRVYYRDEVITIEKKGKRYAVLICPEAYQRYQETAKKEVLRIVKTMHAKNAQLPPDLAEKDIASVVEDVRQARYERSKATKSSH
jgi:prevent-host-death family protein